MMVSCVEARFSSPRAPDRVQWLSDNGSIYAAAKTISDQYTVRSRGGLSTKIHMAVRGLACLVRFSLTVGQKGDAPLADGVLDGMPVDIAMAYAAYDGHLLREAIAAKGALDVIPNNPPPAVKHPLEQALLRPATPHRVLLLEAEAVPSHHNTP